MRFNNIRTAKWIFASTAVAALIGLCADAAYGQAIIDPANPPRYRAVVVDEPPVDDGKPTVLFSDGQAAQPQPAQPQPAKVQTAAASTVKVERESELAPATTFDSLPASIPTVPLVATNLPAENPPVDLPPARPAPSVDDVPGAPKKPSREFATVPVEIPPLSMVPTAESLTGADLETDLLANSEPPGSGLPKPKPPEMSFVPTLESLAKPESPLESSVAANDDVKLAATTESLASEENGPQVPEELALPTVESLLEPPAFSVVPADGRLPKLGESLAETNEINTAGVVNAIDVIGAGAESSVAVAVAEMPTALEVAPTKETPTPELVAEKPGSDFAHPPELVPPPAIPVPVEPQPVVNAQQPARGDEMQLAESARYYPPTFLETAQQPAAVPVADQPFVNPSLATDPSTDPFHEPFLSPPAASTFTVPEPPTSLVQVPHVKQSSVATPQHVELTPPQHAELMPPQEAVVVAESPAVPTPPVTASRYPAHMPPRHVELSPPQHAELMPPQHAELMPPQQAELMPPQQAIATIEPPVAVPGPVPPTVPVNVPRVQTQTAEQIHSALLAPQLRHDGSPIIPVSPIETVSHDEFLPPQQSFRAERIATSAAAGARIRPVDHSAPPMTIAPVTSASPTGGPAVPEEIPVFVPAGPDASAAVLPPLGGEILEDEADGSESSWSELKKWAQPEQAESTFRTVGLLTVISLAPAILLMTTSFIRISVVLGLLRQAIGTQMLPSNQIVTSLAMFLTALVMMPVWQQVYDEAIVPYTEQSSPMTAEQAWDVGIQPVRAFMSNQIEMAQNSEDVLLFYSYLPDASSQPPEDYDDVPLRVLLPAFMISELKIAFLIGFQIYLPFLIIDLVVSSVTVSMGMMMLPPVTVSLPLKLLLFVLVDGWHLVVGMLLQSFGGFG